MCVNTKPLEKLNCTLSTIERNVINIVSAFAILSFDTMLCYHTLLFSSSTSLVVIVALISVLFNKIQLHGSYLCSIITFWLVSMLVKLVAQALLIHSIVLVGTSFRFNDSDAFKAARSAFAFTNKMLEWLFCLTELPTCQRAVLCSILTETIY